MNPREMEGLHEILSCLSMDHLKEIAMITTSHMMDDHFTGVMAPDLVNEIIKNASNASEILHRQKVSKELLLKYLRRKGFDPDPKAKKIVYIKTCLSLWNNCGDLKSPMF
ncbi:uncharacterized protein CDAR_74551 [Caerostris darwini]|uniref:Uncharacterized protein n=1 Tax=Caerostris darwini TaxID=1538125 RepID=A0AAV4NZQ9_9ARAC|nr:uncharacterized protein CDAR_74551 [Caerostris darwini]